MAIDTTVRNFVIESLKGFYERFPKDILSETQFSDLSSMISEGTLVPGVYYRITDYVTTTVQTNTQSANHPFDLVVKATSETELDCMAFALPHEGDTYFSTSDLSKWQVWYDINNDTEKYAWADTTNGKGVIYRLIDEWGNDCPYDFKNIQFKRKLTDGALDTASGTDTWVYTFNAWNEDDSVIEDASLITNSVAIGDSSNSCYNNVIGVYRLLYSEIVPPVVLNDIVFLNTYSIENDSYFECYYNTFGDDCYNNAFGNICYSNTFGTGCNSNTFGNNCDFNTFGDGCSSNTFGNNCNTNTFGDGCNFNTFGDGCRYNTFGENCNHIIFGNSYNQGGTYCRYNVIENGNQYIRLYQTAGTAGVNNQLQNVYIAQGVNNTYTYVDISTIARNLSYRTTVARLSDGTIRIYKEDEDDMLPSITGNAGKVLTVNSGATGVEWTTPDTGDELYVEKTYAQLSSMVSGGTLVKGQKYRVTDYVTTTVQTNTTSANHAFDLVVTATDTNKLDCMAQALPHSGDTYFSTAGADLTKWQVWYNINNDTTKYAWADTTNGKGVIYRLIDEYGNDCPYDFKNILFTVTGQTANAYTFNIYSNSTCSDHSLNGRYCYGNVIKPYYASGVQTLNFNVFYNTSNTAQCYHNTFWDGCHSNTFGNGCNYNTFGNGCYSNTFGDDCSENTFRDECYSNTFGNNCYGNTFGDNCSSNTFGDECNYNVFRNECYSNTFGDYCYSNTFVDNCDSNTFGNGCNYNTFGNGCYSNTFGDECYSNTFGERCNHIVFGNSSNQGGTYCQYNIVENGNQYIRMYQTTGTAGENNQLQNVYIAQGVNATTTYVDISTIARNLSYRTTVAKLSDGTIRIYREDEDEMLPSITGNAGKVLTVNSGATGTEWTTPTSSLAGLSDTTITTPTDGQALIYDNTTSKWVNGAAGASITKRVWTTTA